MDLYEHDSRVNNCLSTINKEFKEIKSLKLIHSGVNSKLFELKHFDNQKSILKIYPNFYNDKRNRLDNERRFLNFLEINNIKNCPRVYYINKEANFSVFSFVEGSKINNPKKINIEKIAEFASSINKFKLNKASELLPYASEATFKISSLLELINKKSIQKKSQIQKIFKGSDFCEWFFKELILDLENTYQLVEEKFLGTSIDIEFDKIISQSDVGFHNLILKDGDLFFIDFEYAGWDNPMKFISDWILQPDAYFKSNNPLIFFEPLAKAVIKNINWKSLIKPYLLLYRLRWCMIITNQLERKDISTKKTEEIIKKLTNYFYESREYIKYIY